jgi:hypothetical protein
MSHSQLKNPQESKTVEELENEINLQSAVITSNKLSMVCDESQKLGEHDFMKPEADTPDKDSDIFSIPLKTENICEKIESTIDVISIPNIDGIENKILEEFSVQNLNIECESKTELNGNSDSEDQNDFAKEVATGQIYDKLDSTEKCDLMFEKEISNNHDTTTLHQDEEAEQTSCDQNKTTGNVYVVGIKKILILC